MRKDADPRKALKKARRVLIKIGSRALVNKKGNLDRAVFRSVTEDLAALSEEKRRMALVSSGAILLGRSRLGLLGRALDMPHKQACAAVGQHVLVSEWSRLLGKRGLQAGQILVTAEDLGDRTRYLNTRNTMEQLLALGVVPIVNENDSVAVEEIRYGDNDHISTLIAVMMRAELLILLTDIDGLCAEDPLNNPCSPVLGLVRERDDELFACAGPSASGVGSGGMATKIEAARTVARRGVATVIANAKTKGIVSRIVAGEDIGTLFVPESAPLGDRKYWLAFGGEVKGSVRVDDGARKAVEERERSLLPSGVTGVSGEFKKGDLVSVRTARGREVARGLTQYGSRDLELIMGHKSGEIEAILGQKLYDEVIHRDYLVLSKRKRD